MRAMNIDRPHLTSGELNAQISAGDEISVVSSLEHENSGLRRIMVELLEENQKLREKLSAATAVKN